MSAKPTNLNEILILCRESGAQNMRTLAVFDLDSTLFDVSTRSQKILQEFAETYRLPELNKVKVDPQDWGIKEALFRAGYTVEKDHDLLIELRDFWRARFFSNEYLHYDIPYTGAINYVQSIAQTGCDVHYLTGRDYKRMQRGSLEVLEKWGFPLASKSHLHMKPEKEQDDELFKLEWFKKLNTNDYTHIFFFENEPININAVIDHAMPVHIVFVETTHSRKAEVLSAVVKIQNYLGQDN